MATFDAQGKRYIPSRQAKTHRSEPQGSSNPEGILEPGEILENLEAIKFNRRQARRDVETWTQELRSEALRARQAGATVAQIGEACGMSRQAVYDLFKSRDRSTERDSDPPSEPVRIDIKTGE